MNYGHFVQATFFLHLKNLKKIAHHFLHTLRFNHRALNLQRRGVICRYTAKCFVYTLRGSIAFSVASSWLFHNKLCSAVSWWCGVGGVRRGDTMLPGSLRSLSRGRHGELSQSVVRRPDNSVRMSRVITLPVLIRQHGALSSQSAHLLPSPRWLQTTVYVRQWKLLE